MLRTKTSACRTLSRITVACVTAAFLQAGVSSATQAQPVVPTAKPDLPFAPEVLDMNPRGGAAGPTGAPPISYDPLSGYQGQSLAPTLGAGNLTYAPSFAFEVQSSAEVDQATLYLVAKLTEDTPNLTKGLVWRIFNANPREDGTYEQAAVIKDSDAEVRLDPGVYLVHTSFGKVTATTRHELTNGVTTGTIVLNAGGIRLDAALSGDQPLNDETVRFDIYDMTYDALGNRNLIAGDVKPGELVAIGAGTYHVVSRYGDLNAVVRADLHVQAGKLTEATLHHRAGEVTLKLVSGKNKISLANTAWTVLTPGGDTVASGNGAFLDLTLAEGTYEVLARNGAVTYRDTFEVKSGFRDVEIEIDTEKAQR
ncbi:hypothetical protein [Pseudovibrio sp. SPO723]|uniref:hypothetical protein n=1 Tax=Nesiotobacter zosterae TaxID=392721 RepID=UPI0029CA408A|nr:hypothetical protein [Pseudovibrio sp. SPO723]